MIGLYGINGSELSAFGLATVHYLVLYPFAGRFPANTELAHLQIVLPERPFASVRRLRLLLAKGELSQVYCQLFAPRVRGGTVECRRLDTPLHTSWESRPHLFTGFQVGSFNTFADRGTDDGLSLY